MAKRKRKEQANEAELAQVEADRLAAHGEVVQPEGTPTEEVAKETPPTEVEPELSEEAVEHEQFEQAAEFDAAEAQAVAEVEEDNKQNNSVVHAKFKDKYLANARAAGLKGKAAKRSNWDWLSQQIAAACLGEKDKIRIDDFMALLEANGVDYSRWTNRNKGWEGRFRMTGRVALQKVVANANSLKMGDGQDVIPPPEFVARFKTKE
jgi:hypothetical protein